MANTINPGNYQGNGIDIEGILAAPFIAAVKANSMMARDQIQFLMDFCFAQDGEVYHPVMITLSITRHEIVQQSNGEKEMKVIEANFEVPLLTLIPMNSLAVQDVDVAFDMEITSIYQKSDRLRLQAGKPNVLNKGAEAAVKLTGTISYDSREAQIQSGKNQYQKKNNSKMAVTMKAAPLPLPVGVTALIEVYAKNVSVNALNNK